MTDIDDCRSWLQEVWPDSSLALAVRHASSGLAEQVDAICSGAEYSDKQVRRAALSVVRYLLRLTGRQMPFGLFAGIAPAGIGIRTSMRCGSEHQAHIRPDAQWLGDVVGQLERDPDLLDRLDVVFTNLAAQRGDDLDLPHGTTRILIRRTQPVQAVQDLCQSPVPFVALINRLRERFAGVSESKIRDLMADLVMQGFLITSLRAPMTISDPLGHVIREALKAEPNPSSAASTTVSSLQVIAAEIARHNCADTGGGTKATIRSELGVRMHRLSRAGRTPLAADLRLDCDVQIPEHVAVEMSHAATALIRLTRQPTGSVVWRDYYTAFCDRYGINALVPLIDVVNPETGLGLPATYPGSTATANSSGPSERDERLLALAWGAMADGCREIVLNDQVIQSLAVGDPSVERRIPPHVELAAQIRAKSVDALDRGDYTLLVHPGRSAGTFTSRLAYLAPEADLRDAYRGVPTSVDGALPVQLSCPPIFAHAENISRVPAYLPHVLSLGEHRPVDGGVIPLSDLAVTATRDNLYLISISQRRVVEPQTFHALAIEKQSPPLARLLAHLSHGLGASWHRFDWGPAAQQLPYLPRVRYRRAILSPATWRLTLDDFASSNDEVTWLEDWRQRWGCPATVELQDADRSLPLTLTEPAHVAIVRHLLRKDGFVVLTETAEAGDLGWIARHPHDIAVPLKTTRPASAPPTAANGGIITKRDHGQLAMSADARWLYLKLHSHPEQLTQLIAAELPCLLDAVGQPEYWFARYRSPRETDHLRLRLRVQSPEHSAKLLVKSSAWADHLRAQGKIGRLVIDTYYPEHGRYGRGDAMHAAEAVFVTDSCLVATQLRHLPTALIDPSALTALNMLGTLSGFFGDLAAACSWLTNNRPPIDAVAGRSHTATVVALAWNGLPHSIPGWNGQLTAAWDRRAAALATYRHHLPGEARLNDVLESLLHMHHNRAIGIDREGEAVCRRLARQAAVTWKAQKTGAAR
ncbi:lantibiotic dehydratase [Kribbella sandramycini]|uniref:Lantibiotic dehydratase n=1 Tax=Kribbella sandramycini TaxID=60450 RepID=A0A7Y4KXN7_9ACTN|nr:lantibiotic dehydratase [Kribbella sandramycini]MBB6569622.1 thiopeptide-type bacteriocin biosynthesis protein [Kribbella sandramycini]NOL40543.1 lantibiotic dehydratase [Kribbella sandramycini]